MKKIGAIINHETVKNYCQIALILLLFSFVTKIGETVFIYSNHSFSNDFFLWQLRGIIDDVGFLSTYILILFPIYGLIFWWKKSIANVFIIFLVSTYFIFDWLLIYYFSESLTPLSVNNLTGMSGEQVDAILEIYGFKKVQLLYLIPAYLFIYFIFWSLRKRFLKSAYAAGALVIILSAFLIDCIFPTKIKNFDSELNYQVVVNKVKYFKESYDKFSSQKSDYSDSDIANELENYYRINEISNPKHFDYPFFSDAALQNPLGNFFQIRDSAPNVVFIICESLGRQFSGSEARLGSFTPFLDSLQNESLYWMNFMSNAERTFGALPNVLAGVPEGEYGFLNLRSKMPNHLSLPLLLKSNNQYETGFFCGANKEYDNMEDYMLFQKFDHYYGKVDFNQNANKRELIEANGKVKLFNWGAEDMTVFLESLQLIDSNYQTKKPYCNVYLTTSFHEPYAYSNESIFITKAKNQIDKINPDNKADYLKELNHFAALMYMDYSLKTFFEFYQKRPEFENTIFVICGDHSIKFMSDNARMEKYHVPLLIYSPMLLRSKKIKSVACHKDIPAALQALLKYNFGLDMPDFSIGQSANLDTLSTFGSNNVNHVLMYADKRMENYVWQNYFLSDGALFQLQDRLKFERVNDEKLLKEMEERLANYRILSNYVCNTNHYIPDSIYSKYVTDNYLFKLKHQFETWNSEQKKYIGQFSLSTKEHFSGQVSATNNGEAYLYFLQGFTFGFENPLRIKIRFKIKSSGNDFPGLYLQRKEVLNNQEQSRSIETMSLRLENNQAFFEETANNGWYSFEGIFWIKALKGVEERQSLWLYLFTNSTNEYYLDDLEIEIREF